jgi:hypothetical protein
MIASTRFNDGRQTDRAANRRQLSGADRRVRFHPAAGKMFRERRCHPDLSAARWSGESPEAKAMVPALPHGALARGLCQLI